MECIVWCIVGVCFEIVYFFVFEGGVGVCFYWEDYERLVKFV